MALTFLDLYNSAASQEWSMYDGDASTKDDFEKPLVVALNKAVAEVLYSHPFPFRERTHIFFTIPGIKAYSMPKGLILKDKQGVYTIKINSRPLKFIEDSLSLPEKDGIPEGFYIRGPKLVLYPSPSEKFIVTADYLTLAVGEDKNGDTIFSFSNEDDIVSVPDYLAEIFKNAVIARAMLNSISSEADENYSAYKKQSEIAYRQLVKYSKGVGLEKAIKI